MGEVKLSRHTGWLGVGVTAASALCLLLQQSNQVKAATVDSPTATAAVVTQSDQATLTGTPTTETVSPTATAAQADYSTTQAQADAATQALAPVQTAFNTYATAVTDYNAALTDQASTAGTQATDQSLVCQQTAATAVTTAQTALADTLIPAVQTAVTDYQTTATAYQAAAGATPVVDQTALTTLQDQLATLQSQATQDLTSTLTANQEKLAQQTALQQVAQAYQAIQTQLTPLNQAASAQKVAVDAWNAKVNAAQADGRWALFFNGDDGLLALANALTTAEYAYADVLNGTTTTLGVKTVTDSVTGKSFDLTTPVSSTAAAESFVTLVDHYQTVVTQYNTTYAANLPTATALLNGVDAAAFSLDFSNTLTTLMAHIEDMLTQIGKLAADPAQNKTVTDRLDINSETFTGTTDGSLETNAVANGDPMQLTATVITLQGESDYATLSTHTFANATAIGNYTANVPLSLVDYGEDVTAANGIVKTTLYDQAGVFDQLFEQTYTDIGALYAAREAGETVPASSTLQGLPATLTLDGVTYYLAAYSSMTEGNDLGQVSETSQIYTFTTTDPVAELAHNPLVVSANKINNTRLFFYLMPVSALPADFAVQATTVQPLSATFTPDTITLTKLTVPTITLTVPNPIPTEDDPTQPDPTPTEDQPTQPDPTPTEDQSTPTDQTPTKDGPAQPDPTPTKDEPVQLESVPTQVVPTSTTVETDKATPTASIINQPTVPLTMHKVTTTVIDKPIVPTPDQPLENTLQSSRQSVRHTVRHASAQQGVQGQQLPAAIVSAQPRATSQHFAAAPLRQKSDHAASGAVTQSQALQSGTPHVWSDPAILPVTSWITVQSTATLSISQPQPTVIVDDALDAILAPKRRLPGADPDEISMLGQFFIRVCLETI